MPAGERIGNLLKTKPPNWNPHAENFLIVYPNSPSHAEKVGREVKYNESLLRLGRFILLSLLY